MRYIDLFAGAGGFSKAIEDTFSDAAGLGFSEINKHAIKVYESHFSHKNLGSIEDISNLPKIDLLTAGSPCQDLSIARGNRKGLEGQKSKLFFEFLRLLDKSKPKYFILENVFSMSIASRETIDDYLGVKGTMLNSSLVSAQNRKRLYWTNIPLREITDRKITLPNVVAWSRSGRKPKNDGAVLPHWKINHNGRYYEERERLDGKANTLTTGPHCHSFSSKNFIAFGDQAGRNHLRNLTPNECEFLQTFPKNWTDSVSGRERYRLMGNAVTVDLIKEILKGINDQSN